MEDSRGGAPRPACPRCVCSICGVDCGQDDGADVAGRDGSDAVCGECRSLMCGFSRETVRQVRMGMLAGARSA